MSKARVAVLEVLSGNLSVTAAARTYGLSRQHLYRLLTRYRTGGLDALEPRSRRPTSNPRRIPDDVIAAIVLLRENSPPKASTPAPSPCKTTWPAKACQCPRPPPSGASCTTTA